MLCFGFLASEDGTDMLSRNFGNKLPLLYVITRKRAVLSYFAAEG